MHPLNVKTIQYLDKVANKLSETKGNTIDGGRFMSGKIRLSNTDKEARMNARIDNMIAGKEFDESGTPPEEYENLRKEIPMFIIKREIQEIFGE